MSESVGNVNHFMALAGILQVAMIVLFGFTTEYKDPGDVAKYHMFQDVHVMMFIGFGFLMTFLRRYGFSALTYNFMITAFSIQWGGWLVHFLASVWDGKKAVPVGIELDFLTDGDIAAAVILISFGALLGRTTPFQLLLMAFFELIVFAANFHLVAKTIGTIDVGGSIVVHTFGAYFGLGVSWMVGVPDSEHENKSIYHSDLFSMVGTLFLWVFWPSFNGYFATGGGLNKAYVNTVLSLSASVISSMIASAIFSEDEDSKKFDMVHIQNSTLAGGVAAGAAADLSMKPGGALATGFIAGILSVWGYARFSPWLQHTIGLADTCGVHNLHGMPGVMGGIVSFIVLAGLNDMGQAAKQLAGLACTLGISIVSGLFYGFVLKAIAEVELLFEDSEYFDVPKDSSKEFYSSTIRGKEAFFGRAGADDAKDTESVALQITKIKSTSAADLGTEGEDLSDEQ